MCKKEHEYKKTVKERRRDGREEACQSWSTEMAARYVDGGQVVGALAGPAKGVSKSFQFSEQCAGSSNSFTGQSWVPVLEAKHRGGPG